MNKTYFSRFNENYENPFNFFSNYLEGKINISDIQEKCMKRKITSETRAFTILEKLNIFKKLII